MDKFGLMVDQSDILTSFLTNQNKVRNLEQSMNLKSKNIKKNEAEKYSFWLSHTHQQYY